MLYSVRSLWQLAPPPEGSVPDESSRRQRFLSRGPQMFEGTSAFARTTCGIG